MFYLGFDDYVTVYARADKNRFFYIFGFTIIESKIFTPFEIFEVYSVRFLLSSFILDTIVVVSI